MKSMKHLLLLAAAAALTVGLAACESTTAPTRGTVKASAAQRDLDCRSGYVIAYDENGNPYCAPDGFTAVQPTAPKPSK